MAAPGVRSATVDALVEVGEPEVAPGPLVIPVVWPSEHVGAAFPMMHAELEFEHVTTDATRLSVVGSYKPPLSVVGAAADHARVHGVVDTASAPSLPVCASNSAACTHGPGSRTRPD